MLLAVIMGLEQPRRSVLSKRRWRRRLLLVSFCRMIVFTRNLSGGPVLEKAVTPLDAGNHEGFRVSPSFHAARADDFACLRSSGRVAVLRLASPKSKCGCSDPSRRQKQVCRKECGLCKR